MRFAHPKAPERACLALLFALALLFPAALYGSDHADPIELSDPLEPGITGLFVFPDPNGDNTIVILNVRRGLTTPGPYTLEPYEYAVHIDTHSAVSYDDEARRLRYGGEVVDPKGISADMTIKIQLNNDATLKTKSFENINADVRMWTGVRDDPFIFPRFFGTNVIAMAMAIPNAAFPAGRQDYLYWGTTTEVDSGEQIDHVGRSNRSQLGRLDFLNTLPPSEHADALHERFESGANIEKFLMDLVAPAASLYEYVLQIRHYDIAPDVMFYTTRFPAGFPNGRLLTDDVAALTCRWGDCVLVELSYTESDTFPRATTNDKEFLTEFPFLAPPWPEKPPKDDGGSGCWLWTVLIVVVVLLVLFWLYRRWKHKKEHPHGTG